MCKITQKVKVRLTEGHAVGTHRLGLTRSFAHITYYALAFRLSKFDSFPRSSANARHGLEGARHGFH